MKLKKEFWEEEFTGSIAWSRSDSTHGHVCVSVSTKTKYINKYNETRSPDVAAKIELHIIIKTLRLNTNPTNPPFL